MLHLVPFTSVFDTNMSELRVRNGRIYIPEHIADECELDRVYDLDKWDWVQRKRIDACRDCRLDNYYFPVIPSVQHPFSGEWSEDVIKFITTHIDEYPIIKCCGLSPKDVRNPPLFFRLDDFLSATKQSERLRGPHCHVVMKKYRPIIGEYRCIYIPDRLRAVIGRNITAEVKQGVSNFFTKYKYDLPRMSICLELVFSPFGWEVMEINAFGPDLICDPEPLQFSQDWHFLYGEEGQTRWIDLTDGLETQ